MLLRAAMPISMCFLFILFAFIMLVSALNNFVALVTLLYESIDWKNLHLDMVFCCLSLMEKEEQGAEGALLSVSKKAHPTNELFLCCKMVAVCCFFWSLALQL